MTSIIIKPFGPDDLAVLRAHCERHRAESGRGDIHFMPFDPDDTDRPKFITPEQAELPLDQPGWQRWFCAWHEGDGRIIGHVDLKNGGLRTLLHRCELGLGIERAFRGQGLGERLLQTALGFAREAPRLEWVDLRVFAHNAPARALYRKVGFTEVAELKDQFRIGSERIADVLMSLKVK